MNKYAEKYPNVIMTQGLLNLSSYGSSVQEEKNNKKLTVLSQLYDEDMGGMDETLGPEEPVGLTEDPWGDNDLNTEINQPEDNENIPPEILALMEEYGLSLGEIMDGPDPYEASAPDYSKSMYANFDMDMADDYEDSPEDEGIPYDASEADDWRSSLKDYFGDK